MKLRRKVAYGSLVSGLVAVFWHRRMHETKIDLVKTLSPEEVARLPHFCYTVNGVKTEPVNLLFVGYERTLRNMFITAGWHPADPLGPISIAKAAIASAFNLSYRKGPMTPYVIDGKLQHLSFQKPIDGQGFRYRHHLRIWKSTAKVNGRQLWLCAASDEFGVKFTRWPLFITHKMSPHVDKEREFVSDELVKVGAIRGLDVQLSEPHEASNVFGDDYKTDGKAAVLEID